MTASTLVPRALVVVGKGTPVLTLHGALGLVNHRSLRPWLEPLAARCRLVFYDQWAAPRAATEAASVDALLAEADAVRAEVGLERVVVLGHSSGSSLALEYARRHPDRVLGLVLVAGSPRLDHLEDMLAAVRARGTAAQVAAAERLLTAERLADDELARVFLEFFPLYFHRYRASYGEWLAGTRPFDGAAWVHFRNALFPALDSLPWLAEVGSPALVVAGRHDIVTPPAHGGERFARGLRQARLVVFEESGHYPFVEEEERFVREVQAFLGGLGKA